MARVLITGANRGIGLAYARLYAARGDEVIAACRQGSKPLEDLGVRIVPGADVTRDAALAAVAETLAGQTLDVLIANAGVLEEDELDTLDFDRIRKQLEVNAVGPLRTVTAFRSLLKRGSRVALMTSRMGSIADNTSGGYYGYRMSKAALNAAGKSLALDLASAGIMVAILHPGYVRTDMTAGHGALDSDESARMLIQRIDELSPATSGTFWHANGDVLPW